MHPRARIGGGNATAASLSSYIVAIHTGKEQCVGALISSTHVVTVASCYLHAKETKLFVGADRSDGSTGEPNSIKSVTLHPAFDGNAASSHNIQYITMQENAPDVARSVKVNTNLALPTHGAYVRVLGYGVSSGKDSDAYDSANVLHHVDLPVDDNTSCVGALGSDENGSGAFCARESDPGTVCGLR